MMTRTIKRKVPAALQAMRRLFAATHWGKGSFQRPDAEGKELFCLVGGAELVTGSRSSYNTHHHKIPDDVVLPVGRTTRREVQKDVMTSIATAIIENPTFEQRVLSSHTSKIFAAELEKFRNGSEGYSQAIIVAFNDHPSTTKDDVLAVLEAAQQYDIINYV